jgi:hypothetical protein
MPPDIIKVIEVGDSFLREDAASFVSFHLSQNQNSLWCHLVVSNPTANGPLTEKLFKSFHCAEILEQQSAVYPIRLRIARVLLYWYYEQLCIDTYTNQTLLSRHPRGRNTASTATDKLLEEIYHSHKDQDNQQVWKRHRTSLQRHKQIRKKDGRY